MTEQTELNYYILFANYTQGMELRDLLSKNGISSRISPTPHSIQGPLSCGMSLLLTEDEIEKARRCIRDNHAEYFDIVEMPCQIQPNRGKFC